MTRGITLAVVFGAACAAVVSSACRGRPPLPPTSRANLALAESAATRVDTIVTDVTELTLRVRDSVPVFGLFAPRALDAAGAEVRGFAPRYVAAPSDVMRLRNGHLVAIRAGEGMVDVRPLRPGETIRRLPSRPVTRVRVRVLRARR